jgi:hypothetical protein
LENEVANLTQTIADIEKEKKGMVNTIKTLEKDHRDIKENYIILHQNYSELTDRYKRLENTVCKPPARRSISSINGAFNLDYLITDGDNGTNEETVPVQENNVVDMKIKINNVKNAYPRFAAEKIIKKKSERVELDGVLIQGKMESVNSNYSYNSLGTDYVIHKQENFTNEKYSDEGSYSSRNRDPDNSVNYDSKVADYVDPKKKEYSLDNSYNSGDDKDYISLPKGEEYGSEYISEKKKVLVELDAEHGQYDLDHSRYSDPK